MKMFKIVRVVVMINCVGASLTVMVIANRAQLGNVLW